MFSGNGKASEDMGSATVCDVYVTGYESHKECPVQRS